MDNSNYSDFSSNLILLLKFKPNQSFYILFLERKQKIILWIWLFPLAIAGCSEQTPISYPEVNIEFLSSTGNIGLTKGYLLKANVSGATVARVDGEEVEIINWIIEKKLVLNDKKQIFLSFYQRFRLEQ